MPLCSGSSAKICETARTRLKLLVDLLGEGGVDLDLPEARSGKGFSWRFAGIPSETEDGGGDGLRPRWPSAERVLGFGPFLSLSLSSGTVVGLVEFGSLDLGAPERSIKFSGAEISSGGCADWRLRSPGKDIFVP